MQGQHPDNKLELQLRKAETVLRYRTDRVLLVLERVLDNTNYAGCLRSAEIMGVQNVWVVQLPRGHRKAELQQQQQQQQQQKKKKSRNGSQSQQDPCQRIDVQEQDEAQLANQGESSYTGTLEDAQQQDEVPAELVGLLNVHNEVKLRSEIKKRLRFSRSSSQWLDVRFFWSIESCIEALQQEGWTIWATDLSKPSVNLLDSSELDPLPDKVALVMGREGDGVSQQLLAAAHRRIYLPMFGFSSSFNVMVATGMLLQAMFSRWPQLRGAMSAQRQHELRKDWYAKLARNDEQRAALLLRADNPPQPFDAPDLKDVLLRDNACEEAYLEACGLHFWDYIARAG